LKHQKRVLFDNFIFNDLLIFILNLTFVKNLEFEAIFNLLIAILNSASPETHPILIKSSIESLVVDQNDKAIQKLKVLVIR
jgi:hypothetical protein